MWHLLRRTGFAEGSVVTVCSVQQKPCYFKNGGNSFLLNSTDLPNCTVSHPRKVIFNWHYVQSSSSSSRYLFNWLRNFCKLATVWPLGLFTKQRQWMLFLHVTLLTCLRSKISFLKSSGQKNALICIYCKT